MMLNKLKKRIDFLVEQGHGEKQVVMMDYMQTEGYFKGNQRGTGRPLTTVENVNVVNDEYFGDAIEILR